MRDAEIRGEKSVSPTPRPLRQRSEPRPLYVRTKLDRNEIDLMHPLAETIPVVQPVKKTASSKNRKNLPLGSIHHKNFKKPLFALAVLGILLICGIVSFRFMLNGKDNTKPSSQQSVATDGYSIAFYTPKNLPKEYTYNNDIKELKKDVYYYSINGPNDTIFYVTQQLIPENFDFTAFNKKFLNPDTFTSEAGTATIGQAGATFLASIRTNKNTWIIVNAPTITSPTALELVSRSLSL